MEDVGTYAGQATVNGHAYSDMPRLNATLALRMSLSK